MQSNHHSILDQSELLMINISLLVQEFLFILKILLLTLPTLQHSQAQFTKLFTKFRFLTFYFLFRNRSKLINTLVLLFCQHQASLPFYTTQTHSDCLWVFHSIFLSWYICSLMEGTFQLFRNNSKLLKNLSLVFKNNNLPITPKQYQA